MLFHLSRVPAVRIRSLTDLPARGDGQFVLYWMTAFRRTESNFALQRAIEWCERLNRPLVVLEAIRLHYRWASDRLHQFVIDGMIDHCDAFERSHATYLPYVESIPGEGSGLVETLAKHACLTVADDFPCFFHPILYERVVKRWPFPVELVDSNTILPMRVADRTFTVAHSYRRYMQKEMPQHLDQFPVERPLELLSPRHGGAFSSALIRPWPMASRDDLERIDFNRLSIDHSVQPSPHRGGMKQAIAVLGRFLKERLEGYGHARNEPDEDGSSWLSPYLHFGHISPHQVFNGLTRALDWNPERLGKPNGRMTGFWNAGEDGDAILDQLLTWREMGFNMCWREPHYDRYDSLPGWAIETLDQHASDRRPTVYSFQQFERAETHDPLWNAAQRQLVGEGRMHNYLRMLWGKKILHWTANPREALSIMIELNNKYALDGRNPNSYSGIFWVLGRYDRAWGPERPIFGKIRYMTSESTRSKFSVKRYLEKWGPS